MTRVAAVVVALAALGCAAAASAASTIDALIRPGRSIAGAQLGMTEAQLRGALGRPLAVVRRRAGFGRSTAEYQYADFELFVHLRLRRGALRVVQVTTFQRRERTREGVGVGSRLRLLQGAYRGRLRCPSPRTWRRPGDGTVFVLGMTCTLPSAGSRTLFKVGATVDDGGYWGARNATAEEWPRYARVTEVVVEAT